MEIPTCLRIFFLLIFETGINAATHNNHVVRQRRALWDFSAVIECMTGRSAYTDYNGYGCWCGKGGWGLPVDESDRCCFNHDECYGSVQNQPGCWSITPYVGSYDFTCTNGDIECSREQGSCRYDSCLCDREMGHCLRRTRYNEDYAPWWAGNQTARERRCCSSLDSSDCTHGGNIDWESSCEIHGNINAIQPDSGIPSIIAQSYNLGVTGVQGSKFALDDDGPSITHHKRCFYQVAHDLGISPALVGALASRLSMGGRQLGADGSNNRFRFLHGLMGCDTRAHDCPSDDGLSCSDAEQTIQRQLIAPLQQMLHANPSLSSERALKSALGSYLSVTNDDASLQFADDVIARAQRLDSFHLWRCVDDERFVPQGDPVQAASNESCLALARAGDCSFYQRCMELKHPCYGKGFALGHGENFCLRYRDHYNEFDDAGKTWIDNMLSCTMQAVYGYARMPDCERSYQLSKQAEARCMKEHGFCGMIEANFDTMREVFEQGVQELYENSWFWEEGLHSFTRTKREKQLWSQVYDMYVSCMYGCETTTEGQDCGSWYKNLWHSFRSSFIFRPNRDLRSVDACLNLAETGDCAFWQCIEDEFGCAREQGTSLPRHFKLPFCFKINTVVDQRARRLLQDTEQCVMRRVAESSDAHESCLDLEFIILTAQTECLAQNGFCGTTKADEWALERVTALKGYPASMPRDFGKISASGKVEMLTETYYQWLQYLKQQFGQAHRLCFYRGDASSPDLYTRVFSDEAGEAGGFVKFRTDHLEL